MLQVWKEARHLRQWLMLRTLKEMSIAPCTNNLLRMDPASRHEREIQEAPRAVSAAYILDLRHLQDIRGRYDELRVIDNADIALWCIENHNKYAHRTEQAQNIYARCQSLYAEYMHVLPMLEDCPAQPLDDQGRMHGAIKIAPNEHETYLEFYHHGQRGPYRLMGSGTYVEIQSTSDYFGFAIMHGRIRIAWMNDYLHGWNKNGVYEGTDEDKDGYQFNGVQTMCDVHGSVIMEREWDKGLMIAERGRLMLRI